jgi:hypothetical protein
MKGHAAKRALSTLSISLLLIAVAAAVVGALAGVVWDYEPVRRIAAWICGFGVVALVASLVNDARK